MGSPWDSMSHARGELIRALATLSQRVERPLAGLCWQSDAGLIDECSDEAHPNKGWPSWRERWQLCRLIGSSMVMSPKRQPSCTIESFTSGEIAMIGDWHQDRYPCAIRVFECPLPEAAEPALEDFRRLREDSSRKRRVACMGLPSRSVMLSHGGSRTRRRASASAKARSSGFTGNAMNARLAAMMRRGRGRRLPGPRVRDRAPGSRR
jgi:hypothetical protein